MKKVVVLAGMVVCLSLVLPEAWGQAHAPRKRETASPEAAEQGDTSEPVDAPDAEEIPAENVEPEPIAADEVSADSESEPEQEDDTALDEPEEDFD